MSLRIPRSQQILSNPGREKYAIRTLTRSTSTLSAQTFNEEQSIKRNEAYSNINLGSALKAGNGKEKEASTNDSGKTSSRRSFRRWKCKTYKTNEHAWFECSEKPCSRVRSWSFFRARPRLRKAVRTGVRRLLLARASVVIIVSSQLHECERL
jgi:hypothetical protein